MKAKVKATGKVVEVKINNCAQPVQGFGASLVYEGNDGKTYFDTDLDFIHIYPDWQQVRIQASIAIMQANYTNPDLMQFLTTKENFPFSELARVSVKSADSLIEELKKTM